MSDTDLTNSNKAEENLKEFLELASNLASSQNENVKNLDEKYVLANIKLVLDNCVKKGSSTKSDISMKILNMLVKNYSKIDFAVKISEYIATVLDKSYFEKIAKMFESDNPENAMKMIQLLIGILGKVLHHNLSITNPLLQIVESGFKHTKNEIKSNAYECWACLIDNFSLDKNFFFKSKTFRLMLMPLQNKCKTYKEEDVCKAKILAWLALLENINEKLPSHTLTVLIPFLNYCFGLNESVLDYTITYERILDESRALSCEHHYASLTQIGFEFFVSIIFNGDLNWFNRDKDLRKKFKYVNINKEYNIRGSLKESGVWLFMIKCFFQLFMNKMNVFDASILLETWKRLCDLLKISYRNPKDIDEKLVKNEKQLEDENDDENEGRFLIAQYFLFNTIEFVNASFFNNKPNENKFIVQLIKHLLQAFNVEYHKIFFKNEKFKSELLKMIKKAATFLLSSDDDLTSHFLDNIKKLVQLSESHANFIDLDNWLYILNKLHDHLRMVKTKTNIINISEENLETIHLCIVYPVKHFKKLTFQENDIKLVIQICSNLSKTFASLIKQARLKIENLENLNVNSFCSRVLFNFNQAHDTTQDVVASLPEETIKLLQIKTQLCLQIMQSIFEFDSLKASDKNMDEDVAPVSQNAGVSLNFSSGKKVDSSFKTFSSLIEFMQRETKCFYDLIMSQQHHHSQHQIPQILCQDSTTSDDSLNPSDSSSDIKKSNEPCVKQPTQIFCYLIETFSLLFTRVKAHQILNEFLIGFALSIEYASELHSISKVTMSNITTNSDSPANLIKQKQNHSRLSISNNINNNSNGFSFQSNRRSNDLYDTFSMQVASYIQNHLTQTYFTHEFDSVLLRKLEPIFYSFLKYSTKMSLKQKTLQAWNSTFGKSTVNSLVYSKRLERLFIELREDMIRSTNSSGSNHQSRSSMGLIAISLPGFKPIDLFNQATNTTNTDDYLSEEKENTPEHLTGTITAPNEIHVSIGSNHNHLDTLKSTSKDFTNESSNSVPMAQLMMKSTFETNKQINHLQQSQAQNSTSVNSVNPINGNDTATINFVFSPAGGQNSFLSTFKHISSSASKISSLKQGTPTNEKANTVRASPRSLKQNSKRKLDLNALLDQMPDKEFVAIEEKNSETALNCNLLHKYETDKVNNKGNKFKKPLTEHQKEVRKQKSFIPLEIQSMCSGLEPTMDSQMSFTNDYEDSMQSQSMIMYPTSHEQVNARKSLPNLKTTSNTPATTEEENANDPMDMDAKDDEEDDYLLASMDMSQAEKRVSIVATNVDNQEQKEEKIPQKETTIPTIATNLPPPPSSASTTPSVASSLLFNLPASIKFQSKINPQKQIELVEVNLDNKEVSPPSSYGSVASSFEVNLAGNTTQPPSSIFSKEAEVTSKIDSKISDQKEIKENTNTKVSEIICEEKLESVSRSDDSCKIELKRRSSARLSRKSFSNSAQQDTSSSISSSVISTTTTTSNTNGSDSKFDSTLTNCTLESFDQSMICSTNADLSEDKVKKNLKVVVRRLKNNKNLFNFYMNSKRKKRVVVPLSLSESATRKLKQRVTFKSKPPRVMKRFTIGSSTMKFSEKFNRNCKMAKYKRLLRNLKKDPIANIHIVKNTEALSDLKDLKEDNQPESQVKVALPIDFKNELISDDEDDDQPLMKLIQKEQSKKHNKSSSEEQAIVTKKPPLETLIEEKKVENNLLPATSVEIVPSTPNNNNRVLNSATVPSALAGLPPNGVTSSAQKLGTPTSILKKRGISKLEMNPLKNSNSNSSVGASGSNNDTPSKRRVSFCDSIQIEEIEPNFNKSLFSRVTPKAQKSKVVLTPYFNKTSSVINSNSSLTTTQTNNITFVNETNATINSTIQQQQNSSNSSSVEMLKQNLLSNMSSSLQSASNKLSNVVGSQSASKLNSTHRLSDQNCLLSPSLPNTNVIGGGNQTNSLTVPSSPSLLTNFFSNKQSFLSQRSTKIQELKTNSPQLPPIALQTQKPINVPKSEQTPPITSDLTSNNTCIYPKFKNSQSSIEALLLNESFGNYLIKGAIKILQSKNIFTIGNLCSISAADLNSLPFKAPKLENFLKFIHKFDESETKELENQEVLSKISACATTTPPAYMGSVEEEMEKLEATNIFDTSIECEKESDESVRLIAEKKIHQEITPSIQMETNEVLPPPTVQTHQKEEDTMKLKIAKDLELMEKDLHEKITQLFKIKHLINDKNVEGIQDLKIKHDDLTMQLRMRFY